MKRILSVAIVVLLSVLTWNHAKVYASEDSLWSDAMRKNPQAWIAYANLGEVRYNQGRMDEALELLDHSLTLKADYAETHNRKGVVLAAKGKLDEAMDSFAAALRITPNHAEAHRNLATALTLRGDIEKALEHFRIHCQLNPNSVAALNSLAWILSTHPNPKFRSGTEAVQLASRAVELTSAKDAGSLETVAAAYAESGDFAKAQSSARAGIETAHATGDQSLASRLDFEFNSYNANQPFRDPTFKTN